MRDVSGGVNARRTEELRRRRERRDGLAAAEREWVCGGPLVDIAKPIIGGNDLEHPFQVQAEIERRLRLLQREADLLAVHFARRCWLLLADERRMIAEYFALRARVGPPGLQRTHSTHPDAGTATIPRLETLG